MPSLRLNRSHLSKSFPDKPDTSVQNLWQKSRLEWARVKLMAFIQRDGKCDWLAPASQDRHRQRSHSDRVFHGSPIPLDPFGITRLGSSSSPRPWRELFSNAGQKSDIENWAGNATKVAFETGNALVASLSWRINMIDHRLVLPRNSNPQIAKYAGKFC